MSWRGLAKRVMSPSFGNQRCRNHQRHATQRVQACTTVASDQSGSAASMWAGFQTVAPCRRRLDSRNAALQHDVMHRMLEAQAGQPSAVPQRPRRTFVVMAMAQQKARQLLTGLTQRPHSRLTRTRSRVASYAWSGTQTEVVHQPDAVWRG
jgi:hypothetical protein